MALSAFAEKNQPPEPGELERVLGSAAGAWRELIAHVGESFPPVEEQWGFPGAKYGWSLRLRRHDRVVLYMTPQDGRFLVGVVLGEKAVAAARRSGLPESVMARLDAAPRYAEGRGIRLEVVSPGDLDAVRRLAEVKMRP